MKNKKTILIAFIVLVLLLVVILILVAKKGGQGEVTKNEANDLAAFVNSEALVYQGDSVELQPQIITVSDGNFTPQTISAPVGSKVNLIFRTTDDETHRIVFSEKDLSYIDLSFSKAEGDKTLTFPAPQAGTYTFTIDEFGNKGTFTVK